MSISPNQSDREGMYDKNLPRAPHLLLESASWGTRLSVLDLLDGNFMLLVGAEGEPWIRGARAVSARLGREIVCHRIGDDLIEIDTSWEERYDVTESGAVLVLPNGVVGWRARAMDEYPERTLEEAVRKIIAESDGSRPENVEGPSEIRALENVAHFTVPPHPASAGRLVIASGASRLMMVVDHSMTALLTARYERPIARVEIEGSSVTIDTSRHSVADWLLNWRSCSGEIALSPSVSWSLYIRGGASRLIADLRGLRLDALHIEGGLSEVELMLGAPAGSTLIQIGGGASDVVIHRPADVPVRMQIKGGTHRLSFDNQQMGAIGGGVRLESTGFHDARSRYDIRIGGGASNVTVDAIG